MKRSAASTSAAAGGSSLAELRRQQKLRKKAGPAVGPLESTLARTTTSEVATVLLRQSQCAATEHRAAAAAPDSSGTSVFRSQTTMSATSNNMTTTNQRLPFQRTDSAASGTSSTERSAWEILYAAKGERELDMEFQGVYADAASEEDGSEDGDERERVYGDDDDALRDYMYDYDVEEELADLYDMHGQENLDGSTLALNATNNPFSKMESGEEPPVGHVAVTMAHSKRALLTRLDQLADVDQAPAKKHSAVTDLQDMLAPAAKRLADGDSKSGSKVQSPKPTFADTLALPIDWNRKSAVTFHSAQPFTWCSEVTVVDRAQAMGEFVRGGELLERDCAFHEMDEDTFKQAMERCLRAWLFDESSSREVDEHEVLRTSDRYTEALQSLYFSWKTRGCEYFYYMLDGPMGCEVLFRNNTASSAGDGVTATMSSCNDVLLRHLTESGITFQWLDKERYYTGSSTPPTAASPMNSPSSPRAPKPRRKEQQQAPVIIHGFDAVHLLYDFLLNQRFRPSLEAPTKMPVFPRLLSPSAFAQARLVSARITKNNRVKRAMKVSTGNVASSTSEESPLQQLRIEGHLLPRSLHCLLSLMTAKQLCDTDVILTSAVGATSGSVSANSFPCGDRVSGTLKALRYRSGDFQVQIG